MTTTAAIVGATAPDVKPDRTADRILAAARAGPGRTAAELARDLGLSRRTADHHARRLEAAGLVARVGKPYRLHPAGASRRDGPAPDATDGDRLRALRERLTPSQAEAARRAGVPRCTLARAESGSSHPLMASVLAWARAWGATRADLAATILAGFPDA